MAANYTHPVFICHFFFFPTVSAEILKSSLTNMERQIQRLENDIEHFPKTDDQQDKFVEKMSISFFLSSPLVFYLRTSLGLTLKVASEKTIGAYEGILCTILSVLFVFCLVEASSLSHLV